ncbi:MAG: T9SS type A sorting domain-containing protein, partial [Candidatus Kapabacteria bacterium]|nr:T9SS type A sorting domain-containing protein [Candidatus Kapabacteria bacterium]
NFPTSGSGYSRTRAGLDDGFVTIFNNAATALVASTYIGSIEGDYLYGIAVNSTGVAVTGSTFSNAYPVTSGVLKTSIPRPAITAVVSIFNTSLQTLTASTYLGNTSMGRGITFDAAGNVCVVGRALDDSFPVTANAMRSTLAFSSSDGYAAKINSSLTALIYSTFIGGYGGDEATGVAVDAAGAMYVCGNTMSPDLFVTVGAYDRTYNSQRNTGLFDNDPTLVYNDGFVIKFNGSTFAPVYSTYIGGKASDFFRKIRVDPSGNAILSGETYSTNFPTTACSMDSSLGGPNDGVLVILNSIGTALIYSTFLGGGSRDFAHSCWRDAASGHIFVCGESDAGFFPMFAPSYQPRRRLSDAFLTRIDPTPYFNVYAGDDVIYSCGGVARLVYFEAQARCGTPPYTYSWTPSRGLSDTTIINPILVTDSSQVEYEITVTDATGKVAKNTISVIPWILRKVPAKDTVICWGRSARLATKVFGGLGPKSYSWFPTDGLDSANVLNPLANPGRTTDYILIVSDTTGCQISDTIRVNISNGRIVSTRDTTLCGGNKQVKLSPTYAGAIPPLRYQWFNQAGNLISSIPAPTFTIDSSQTIQVLIRDSLNCLSRDSFRITYSSPITQTITGDTLVCKGSEIKLRLKATGGIAPYRIRWNATDTTLSLFGTDSTLTTVVQKNTTFSAILTDSAGCLNTKTFLVRVDSAANPKISTASKKFVFCQGSSLELDAGQYRNTTYKWSTGETTQKIKVTAEGWYGVQLRSPLGCIGIDSVFVAMQPLPKPVVSAVPDTVICDGSSAILTVGGVWKTYRWSDGTPTAENTVYQAGTYFVTVTDSVGCTGVSQPVRISKKTLSAEVKGPTSVCAGVTVNYTVEVQGGATSFTWVLTGGGGGLISAGQGTNGITARWTASGVDTVSIVVIDPITQCTTVARLEVRIGTTIKPDISSVGKPVICGTGSSVVLQAAAGYDSYQWSTGETTQRITVTTPGSYSVRVQSGGCSGGSDTLVVKTAPPISVAVTGDSVICPFTTAQLRATGGFANYQWTDGTMSPDIIVRDSGAYTVTVTDTAGCTAQATFRVRFHRFGLRASALVPLPPVKVNQQQQFTVVLTNTSPEEATHNVAELKLGTAFSIVSVVPPIGSPVAGNGRITITVNFAPRDSIVFTDTVLVVLNKPCSDTVRVVVQGSGAGNTTNIRSTVAMTTESANVGDSVSMPVIISVTPKQSLQSASVAVRITMDTALFLPISVTRGTIIKNSIENGERVLVNELRNTPFDSSSVFSFTLRGQALTDFNRRPVMKPSLQWLDSLNIPVTSVNGELIVKGCGSKNFAITLSRLAQMMVMPNPSDNDVNVTVVTGEEGLHTVQLYSATGTEVARKQFSIESTPGGYEYALRFTDIPSGMYTVILRTALSVQTANVLVIK